MGRERDRLSIEYVRVGELRPDPFNPRRIAEEELEALTRSIGEYGLVDPLVVRREDNTVIGGHQRLIAAKRLGYTEVPVVYVDVSSRQARLLNLALNRISGEWDEDLLARLLGELKVGDADLTLSGFDRDELTAFLKSLETRERRRRVESFDVGEALADAQKAQPRAQLGDLYLLGPHRLLCGDAGSPADFARLVGGERVDLAFTDPPYGVNYNPEDRARKRRVEPGRRLGGILGDDEPQELVEGEWENLVSVSREGSVYYVCAGTPIMGLLHRLFSESCGREPTVIVWGKESFSLSRRDYHPQYEFIFYGWLGAAHYWCGDRRQSDLWLESREPTSTYSHPTQKPLALVERALTNSSQEGDLVLDPFLGSGTTLIACERLSRRCNGMELDPYYVDVAVARWEAFTGEKAEVKRIEN